MNLHSVVETAAPRKPRILFIAEAISLAHVVRLAMLAERLDRSRYDVWFASARFPDLVFKGTHFKRRTIESVSPERMLGRVARAQPPWDERELARYVEDDLRLLHEVRPDLVVGDFRLSLAVSAPVTGTPCASLINAYWSPHAVRDAFPIPEHPLVRLLGPRRVASRWQIALPFVFQRFARPLNALRKRYGLAPLGSWLETLTFGDHTLYADIPELAPTRALPAHHHYLGTLSWSPRVPLPAFWSRMDHARPLVYVTLGSSGDLGVLDAVLSAGRSLPITMLVATAGRCTPSAVGGHVWVTDFVPGDVVARRAALVVSNGGSTTSYQALEAGTPVLGLPSNLDQYLAAEAVARTGAGSYLRSGAVTAGAIVEAIERMLFEAHYRAAAARLQSALAGWDACARFGTFVEGALESQPRDRARAR